MLFLCQVGNFAEAALQECSWQRSVSTSRHTASVGPLKQPPPTHVGVVPPKQPSTPVVSAPSAPGASKQPLAPQQSAAPAAPTAKTPSASGAPGPTGGATSPPKGDANYTPLIAAAVAAAAAGAGYLAIRHARLQAACIILFCCLRNFTASAPRWECCRSTHPLCMNGAFAFSLHVCENFISA